MSHELSEGAFTKALSEFSPSAEPWCNMSLSKLELVKAECLKNHDTFGYWNANLHFAEKLPPVERYIHDLGDHLLAWLRVMEGNDWLPKDWTFRNGVALWTTVHHVVKERWTDETIPYRTPSESREHADDEALMLANKIRLDPSKMERYQAKLQSSTDEKLTPPGFDPA